MILDVSVCIPIRNRLPQLKICLNRMLDFDCKPREICIADDGSTDGLREWVLNGFEIPIVYSKVRDAGEYRNSSVARNVALKSATSEYILVQCPEMYHVNNVTELLYDACKAYPIVVARDLYCVCELFPLDKLLQIQELAVTHPVYPHPHTGSSNDKNVYRSNGYAFVWMTKKNSLDKIGGWNESLTKWGGEDIDVLDRINRAENFSTEKMTEMGRIGDKISIAHLWHDRSDIR